MTTQFYYPTNIQEVIPTDTYTDQPIITWEFNNSISNNSSAYTKNPLYTISGLWMEKYLSNTSELWCTGLNIPETDQPVVGIEFFLSMHRFSRIEDLRIQLTFSGHAIGENLASHIDPVQANMYTGDNGLIRPIVGDTHTYGGTDNLWGVTGLISAHVSDPSFGIIISFKSNQVYPHRDIAQVNQVAIGITYG